MKNALKNTALTLMLLLTVSLAFAQDGETKTKIVKNDGATYVGDVISMDDREVYFETEELGSFYIPKHEISSIETVEFVQQNGIELNKHNRYATRYFYSTNGLPLKKGEHYAAAHYYGPEIHFAVADNFSIGAMTTWIAAPIVGSAKYSISLGKNASLGIGGLAGSLSWLNMDGVGALGYTSLTLGNENANFTVSGGVLGVRDGDFSETAPLASVAGMVKINPKVSLVADSFFYLGETRTTVLIPGVRFHSPEKKVAVQLGMGMGFLEDESIGFPAPMATIFVPLN